MTTPADVSGSPPPPVFTAITLANGNNSNLQVVGLGQDGRAYLVAWQCAATGVWRIQNSNALSSAKGSYSQLVLTVAADNKTLQLIGLASDDNIPNERHSDELYLLAWQDNGKGTWNLPLWGMEYGYPLCPGGKFKSFQAALGGDGKDRRLEVVGLGKNNKPYRAGHQVKSGEWYIDKQKLSDQTFEHESLVMAQNSEKTLLVFGISGETAYIVAYGSKNGSWSLNQERKLRRDVHFNQLAPGLDDDGTLQLLGQKEGGKEDGSKDEIWLVGYDEGGTWHEPYEGNTGNLRPGWNFQGVVVGKALDGLKAFGVGNDPFQVYMVARHSLNGWSPPPAVDAGIIGGQSPGGYWPIVAAHRSGNSLLLAGLRAGTDNLLIPAIVAHMDNFGNWKAGQSLSLRDRHGSWNPRVTDVKSAFLEVNKDGVIDKYQKNEVSFESIYHFQGMARYRHYDILTHDSLFQGYIVLANRLARKLVTKLIDVPNDNERNHPDGCQVIGDYMVMGLENFSILTQKGKVGVVRFYWLGCMTDETPPELLPLQISHGEKGVGAAAITDIGAGGERHYLVAVYDDGAANIYTSNGFMLDDPKCEFSYVFTQRLDIDKNNPTNPANGADNICLLTDGSGQAYLISLPGGKFGGDNYAVLWKVNLSLRKLELVGQPRQMYEHGSSWFPPVWIGFRFGAGVVKVVDKDSLQFFCSERNVAKLDFNLVINNFNPPD